MSMNPKYPIYIPSKGRWSSRITMKHLDRMGVDYNVIVEEQELPLYAAEKMERATLLALDTSYQRAYDPCMPLNDNQSRGSGPARNFAWDHAKAGGHAWHWVIDDNIDGFYRFNRNSVKIVADGTIFRCAEEFCSRYANVSMAGFYYQHFMWRRVQYTRPFVLNMPVYSCNLIKTTCNYRWRSRYNEDVDLSIRMLRDGWCTIVFLAFIQRKLATQTVKGGNTDELYKDGTLMKSQVLARLHPDVCKVVWRFGRPHHKVDYSSFRRHNRLVRKSGVEIPPGVDDYGMKLVHLKEAAA